MKYLIVATIIAIAYILFSFKGNMVKASAEPPVTGYYYFELIPKKADMPYYFSQSVYISFTDIPDLLGHEVNYFHELNIEAYLDGRDTLNYTQYVSLGSDTKEHCDAIRVSAEMTLNADNKNVINKIIN
ncbi:MAG: hypothetical protein ACLQQ4_09005 [Bacteroidia bacterium]